MNLYSFSILQKFRENKESIYRLPFVWKKIVKMSNNTLSLFFLFFFLHYISVCRPYLLISYHLKKFVKTKNALLQICFFHVLILRKKNSNAVLVYRFVHFQKFTPWKLFREIDFTKFLWKNHERTILLEFLRTDY